MGNRLSKIATRTGDAGTTGLGDGSRIDKDALRVHAMGEKSVSDKMMLLYKDETYRNQLISKGAELAAARNWENAADQLWNSINPVSE